MAKYLVEASYLSEGINGLLKEGGTRRREAVDQLFNSLGRKVEAFYFVFGDRDVVIIGELPDNATAAVLALRVDASGTTTCKTTVLLTPKEIDAAMTKTVPIVNRAMTWPPRSPSGKARAGILRQVREVEMNERGYCRNKTPSCAWRFFESLPNSLVGKR
ncbi:uncharacterized protein with GYD domain [Massilia sp. UYP11]|uniref:GYD domain-containing protein n=1 Tax=Massilia sp. UYP11 TaxID=1756385 RepID=UPI003D1B358C